MVNSKLHLLEWNGVALGYQSLQVALALRKIQADTEKESPLTS